MSDHCHEGSFFVFLMGIVTGVSLTLFLMTPEGKKTFKKLKGKYQQVADQVEETLADIGLEIENPPEGGSDEGDKNPIEQSEDTASSYQHINELQLRGRDQARRFFKRH